MKHKRLHLLLALAAISAAILACTAPVIGGGPQEDPAGTNTAVAETVSARLTEVWEASTPTSEPTATSAPTNTPLPTSTPLPTNTPVPTNTKAPTVTATPALCNAAQFVRDLTVVDDSEIPANTNFVKVWMVRNVGTCTWTKDYEVIFDSGDKMGGSAITFPKKVAPGETVELAIAMKAPSDKGKYKGNWMLKSDKGKEFGIGANANSPIFVQIKVTKLGHAGNYDFAVNLCKANWKSDAGSLFCIGNPDAYKNNVRYSSSFQMEDNRTEDESAILMQVNYNERVRGTYPYYTVQAGDHFISEIGCLKGATTCNVRFHLTYKIKSSGVTGSLGEWTQKQDGTTEVIDIDLAALVGEEVQFTLDVESKAGSGVNQVFWFVPQIRNP